MRRSELIKKIDGEIKNALNAQGVVAVPLDELANQILKICEGAGMLPPSRTFWRENFLGYKVRDSENEWDENGRPCELGD